MIGTVARWLERPLFTRVARGLLWGLLAEFATKGSLFLVTMYLAVVLGAADFGKFAFFQTVFVFVWMGVDLGLNMYAVREVAKAPAGIADFIADFSGMRLVLAAVLAGIAVLIAGIVYGRSLELWLAAGFGLYVLARAVQPDWLLRGQERYFELSLVNTAIAVILLLATYAMVRDAAGARFASMPWFITYLLGAGGVAAMIRLRQGIRFTALRARPRRWLDHWRESIHFTLSNGVSTLHQNVPLLYVYYLGSAESTGLFAAPFRLAVAMIFVAQILPMVVYPVLTDLYCKGRIRSLKRLLAAICFLTVAGAGAVSVVLWLEAEAVLELLFGPAFVAGANALQWLAVYFLLRSVRAVFARMVTAAGRQRDYSVVSILAASGLVILLPILALTGVDPLLAGPVALVVCEAGVLIAMGVLTVRILAEASSQQAVAK